MMVLVVAVVEELSWLGNVPCDGQKRKMEKYERGERTREGEGEWERESGEREGEREKVEER